jgi:hypothetical protein
VEEKAVSKDNSKNSHMWKFRKTETNLLMDIKLAVSTDVRQGMNCFSAGQNLVVF